MVPKLHKKGTSFKGAAAYLLHDKGGKDTNARVEWTETRNLATRNPEAAWRVMAATAMDQERMKRTAGVKSTGRKSKDAVLHLTIAWHPSEKVSREEMTRAADEALKSLGAEDRQVVLVCHNDEPHQHVHLLINRVSPSDGKMLSSSKEKLALSKWAEQYEKSRGSIVCPERVRNNARREKREYTRGKKERSRPEQEQKSALARVPSSVRIEQKKKYAELATKTRELVARQKSERAALEDRARSASRGLRAKVREMLPRYKLSVERVYIDRQSLLQEKQRKELVQFCRDEKNVLGRMVHRLQSIDFKALLQNQGGERQTLRDAMRLVVSSEARIQAFKARQRKETRELERKRSKAVSQSSWKIFAGWKVRKVKVRLTVAQERRSLWEKHQKEWAENRAEWKSQNAERDILFSAMKPAKERTSERERTRDDDEGGRERERRRGRFSQ